jgi:DNA-binding transcriptional MerR regulator
MDRYSISEVAERTGFPASTLRFYEQHGLVRPDRTPAGYRTYREHHVEQLEFIGRAKGFGLTLGEITELLGLLEEDRCAPVQDRLRTLVDDKIAEADTRVAELEAFTAELRRVSAALDTPAPEGPCDDTCGCTSHAAAGRVPVRFGRHAAADLPVACAIAPVGVDRRVREGQP